MLESGTGGDIDLAGGELIFDQEGGGTARAVAGDFHFAAIGIEQADAAVGTIFTGSNQEPAVGTNPAVAIANGFGDNGEVLGRSFRFPGKEEVVFGTVGFGEGDAHAKPLFWHELGVLWDKMRNAF